MQRERKTQIGQLYYRARKRRRCTLDMHRRSFKSNQGQHPHPMRYNTWNAESAARVERPTEKEVGDYANWAGTIFHHLPRKSFEWLFHFFGGCAEGNEELHGRKAGGVLAVSREVRDAWNGTTETEIDERSETLEYINGAFCGVVTTVAFRPRLDKALDMSSNGMVWP